MRQQMIGMAIPKPFLPKLSSRLENPLGLPELWGRNVPLTKSQTGDRIQKAIASATGKHPPCPPLQAIRDPRLGPGPVTGGGPSRILKNANPTCPPDGNPPFAQDGA
jgi:hypothetical protein